MLNDNDIMEVLTKNVAAHCKVVDYIHVCAFIICDCYGDKNG